MKNKHLLVIVVVFLLTALSMSVGLWLAHTKVITSGIISLSDYLSSKSLKLSYDAITFSKNGVMNINASMKNVRLNYENNGMVVASYRTDELKLYSNMWNTELLVEFTGDINFDSKNEKMEYAKTKGLYRFAHNPMLKIVFKNPFTQAWNSKNMIQHVELEKVGYDRLDEINNQLEKTSSVESIWGSLDNKALEQEINWDLKTNITNQLYFIPKQQTRIYELMKSSGSNNAYMDINISSNSLNKENTESDKHTTNINVREFKASSSLYNAQLKGAIEISNSHPLPYFDLQVTIQNLDKLLFYYLEAANIVLSSDKKIINTINITPTKEHVIAILKTLNGVSEKEDNNIIKFELKLNKDNLLVSGVPGEEILKRIMLSLKNDQMINKRSKHKKKRNDKA